MYSAIELPILKFIELTERPRLLRLYEQLLSEFIDVCYGVIDYVAFTGYSTDYDYFGYESKSGLWKALNKLQNMGLIEIQKDKGKIIVKGTRVVLDE